MGKVETASGPIPRIPTALEPADRWGTVKARWGIGRMTYTVDPGLYAAGNPDEQSPVLVTANYKMSFDRLRSQLSGRPAWMLVLDTRGINVWCAAGKGTFGTDELVLRIRASGLSTVVSHRKLILPQLGAPGIAAHMVKKQSGFSVVYGPVEAADLPRFLDCGEKATPQMRRKTFPIAERAALIPMELVPTLKWVLLAAPVLFLLGGLISPMDSFDPRAGLFALAVLVGGLAGGTVLTPLLLPWLPGRSFSVKGAAAGFVCAVTVMFLWDGLSGSLPPLMPFAALALMAAAAGSFLGMNFTGSSTYTSLSGVRKEMKRAVPAQIAAAAAGLILWVGFALKM